MAYFRLVYRSVFVILMVVIGAVLTPLLHWHRLHRRGIAAWSAVTWHRWLGRALGIRINVHGTPADEPMLYVANHVSWFDISAVCGAVPVRFLSKDEVRRWPLIGWLASRTGTLYIKRGGKDASKQALETMAAALSNDQNVCLFAEGTTTDGRVRRFHGRLMQSAIDAGVRVQPVAIVYPPESTNADTLAHPDILFVGDTSFASSFLRIMTSRGLHAEVHFLEAIETQGMKRDDIAARCERMIRETVETRAS